MYIRVTGYSDSKGSSDYNKKLSSRRVSSVVAYLKEKGIEQDRIRSRSLGSTTRFSKGESEKERRMNRRVEITLIKKESPPPAKTKINVDKEKVNKEVVTKLPEKSYKNLVEIENVVSHEIKKIAADNIEFEIPSEMIQGEIKVIEASVSESIVIELIKRLDKTTYKRISPISNIRIDEFMLSGKSFLVNRTEGENLGKWIWEVTPGEPGTTSLMLSAKMDIVSNKSEQTLDVPIFLKAVNVKSKTAYYLSLFISSGLYIVFLIVLALGIFTMVSKKNNSENIKKD